MNAHWIAPRGGVNIDGSWPGKGLGHELNLRRRGRRGRVGGESGLRARGVNGPLRGADTNQDGGFSRGLEHALDNLLGQPAITVVRAFLKRLAVVQRPIEEQVFAALILKRLIADHFAGAGTQHSHPRLDPQGKRGIAAASALEPEFFDARFKNGAHERSGCEFVILALRRRNVRWTQRHKPTPTGDFGRVENPVTQVILLRHVG